MFWADKIAKKIIDSGKYTPYWVDDMKTPSGRIHVGSLRGVVVHDSINRALKDSGQKVTFSYVFEDQDPMDGLPIYLEKEKWEKYLGQPLFTIPSPDPKAAKNYAEYFALEFKHVFNKIGSEPKIIWSADLYKSGKMNKDIKICLDKADIIRDIYEKMYKKSLQPDWYPFQVVCPKCGKESTTRVYKWDSENVHFTCKEDAVDWTKGCGYEGKISPFSNNGKFVGKLSWKVEWAVKWKVIGVTIEGAGKDHMGAGGSHDIAEQICKRVIDYPTPFGFSHEFFLIGGKKMSSSKGMGVSAKEVSDIMPPYLVRFMFTRTDYRQAIEFDPVETMAIPDLFDEYDRCWQAYNKSGDPDLSRAYELSQIDDIPPKNPNLFIPRFRDIANFRQLPNVKLWDRFAQIKGSSLTDEENDILQDRLTNATVWLSKYAPNEYKYQISIKSFPEITLSENQWKFLNGLAKIWQESKDPEKLQSEIFQLTKSININYQDAFKALYTVILDKPYGPRAGWLLNKFPKDVISERLTLNKQQKTKEKISTIKTISRPDIFSIDPKLKEKYPSISIGIAIIKGIKVEKTNPELEKEKEEFLSSIQGLTTEELGKYPEIISYRRLYKETGIDWHSRRPSPEALLRRVALKKGLYTINTCVDSYNLIVMKHRVSVGAFDLDKMKLPTIIRFAKKGEEIHLLGDEKPTAYTEKEIAYFDAIGGYNIDFNFRDAKRTAVTLDTKNVILNLDGIYDATRQKVQRSLDETIAIIQKYCGGSVEMKGLVI